MHLLIACAGSGRRMGAPRNKLLLPVAGRPVLAWTLDAALASASVRWIGIVGQAVDRADIQGGDTRQDSVSNGLAALPADAEVVLIHDGARCLVDPALIDRCAAAVAAGDAVIAAAPVTDTIKRVDAAGVITATPDRAELWGAQTPQGFAVEQLRQAHALARREGWSVTDDASLFERLGWPVKVLESSPANIKITTPFDITIAEAVLAAR
jgi:2-C-methyl-D-erythritol 4-phosphate cytidylyltransferase